jgi:hypothetical protein
MSLVSCPACGATVSAAGPACPKCGQPIAGAPLPQAAPPASGGSLFLRVVVIGCLLFLVIGGVIAASCVFLVGKTASNMQKLEKERVARENAEPISAVTWEELDRIFNVKSGYTDLQKKEAWKNYQGKKVKWSGTVAAVGETLGTLSLQVKMNSSTFVSDVLVKIEPAERESALMLRKDDRVTFVGILDDWGTLMPFTLSRGQIVR